jgi:hypothetical protein
VPASKWFAKDSMKMTFLSLKGREKGELALKILVDVVVPILRRTLAFSTSFGRKSLCVLCPPTRVANMLLGSSR